MGDDAAESEDPGPGGQDVRGVQPAVVRALPEPYREVLAGVVAADDDVALAARAGVDPSAVPALVRLALAKLLAAQDAAGAPGNA